MKKKAHALAGDVNTVCTPWYKERHKSIQEEQARVSTAPFVVAASSRSGIQTVKRYLHAQPPFAGELDVQIAC